MAHKEYGCISYEKVDGEAVGVITLNRPEKLNAINTPMILELDDAIQSASRDPEINAVIIKGAGRAFSAGYDLDTSEEAAETTVNTKRLGTDAEAWRDDMIERCVSKMMNIWNAPIATIAQVHGYALGGALDLVMCCDLAIAASDAKLGEPEIRHISSPPTLIMPWVMPIRHTRHLLFTGDMVSGIEAERMNLVNRAVPAEDLDDAVMRLALKLGRMPTPGIKINKAAINNTVSVQGLHNSLMYAVEVGAMLHTDSSGLGWMSKLEGRGVQGYLEVREAPFKDLPTEESIYYGGDRTGSAK